MSNLASSIPDKIVGLGKRPTQPKLMQHSELSPTQLTCTEYFRRTDATASYFTPAWYEVCKDSSVSETQDFAENCDIHQFK